MKIKFLKEIIKKIVYLLFLPVIITIFLIKPFKKIQFCELSVESFGVLLVEIEGYLRKKKFSNSLEKNLIIFFFSSKHASQQLKIMIERVVDVKPYRIFLKLLSNAIYFWGMKSHIVDLAPLSLINCEDFQKKKIVLDFNVKEKKQGEKLLANLGIRPSDKWICIHNRDESYREKYMNNQWPRHYGSWSYHSYRNFSVKSLKSAAEFFASKGYFVLRMGKVVEKKLYSDNKKIIDYANTSLRSDFADMYLLANCEAYFGGESGIFAPTHIFKKPVYFINTSSTHIWAQSKFNHYPFTFKRMKNIKTGKLLTIKEILKSNIAECTDSETFKQNGIEVISNTSEEIKSFAIEAYNEINGIQTRNEEDIEIQNNFWNIYYNNVDANKFGGIKPKLSTSFLRNNIDLIN